MSETVEQLREQLAKLQKTRASGASKIEFRDRSTWFKTDAEMAAAIRDLEERIAKAEGVTRPTIINIRNAGGWQ